MPAAASASRTLARDLLGLALIALIGLAGYWLFPDNLAFLTRVISVALLVLSLDLIVGYCGVASLGQGALYGAGAYAAGKLFGKRKLCPELSPAKTVEGAVGALVWAVGLSLYWAPRYLDWSIPAVVAAGLAIAVCGILGDLLESAAKRWAGVKDSSQIFPGHGGAFDRFDSLLLAAPVLWAVFVALR